MVIKFWTVLNMAAAETSNCQYASHPDDVGRTVDEDLNEGLAVSTF